jgi:hypothetical protein
MGDPRNKIRRLLDDQRIARRFAELSAASAARARSLPRCACGNTWNDVWPFIAYHGGYWDKTLFFCPGCCPPRFRSELLRLTVSDRRAYLGEDWPDSPGGENPR